MALPNYEKKVNGEKITDISVSTNISSGWINAKKIGNIVIVHFCAQIELPDAWTNYTVATLNGVTAKYESYTTIVNQISGLCADANIMPNSNEIKVNKRGASSVTGEWFRGQLIFIAN